MKLILNYRTGETGDMAAWVARFAALWSGGSSQVERFMDIMGPEIRLSAPGLRTTRGREAGTEAFRRAFAVLPDLTGEVNRWAAAGDGLFVEMTFRATIGGRPFAWDNVDRFLFRDGWAVERVAYYDAARIRRAFLSRPAGWVQLWRRRSSGL